MNGIQLTRGPHKGRLVIPANHTEVAGDGTVVTRSHVVYSDDHGATWHLGGVEDKFTNESTVVELADGSLLQNMRCYRGNHRRAVAVSRNGGASWSPVRRDEALIGPVCQGSILRCTWPGDGQKSRILFLNPASLKRENMTMRVSYDEGATWSVSRALHAGPAAYSCMTMLPDGNIGCLYECGERSPYERIVFERVSLDWLEQPSNSTTSMPTSNSTTDEKYDEWKQLPPLPDPLGFAGAFAGVSDHALIVAGGANFPHGMPWDGGQKAWHDSIFVLTNADGKWLTGFKLSRPLGYGVSVSTADGVICAGGSNAEGIYRDVFLMRWADGRIQTQSLPPLPEPMANGCGALVGNTLYVAGGIKTPDATQTLRTFWALDLSAPKLAWRELKPWPGPGRMLSVAGACDGSFYLFSGAELHAGADGKPVRRYLTDAYVFKPGMGWEKLPDMPRPAVAAPSPALTQAGRLLIVSGDDGKLVDFEPKPKHPGFPKDVLAYDPKQNTWTQQEMSP
ncbi:MAG TPA: exo-alpha-sialidase, partial [Candidatus Binatia bacterium]|nr:exo-alpha-sialidase [Candidatus Binatia bacterium]